MSLREGSELNRRNRLRRAFRPVNDENHGNR